MHKPALALTLLMLGMLLPSGAVLDRASAAEQRYGVGAAWDFQIEGNPSSGYVWRLDQAGSENLAIVKVEDLGYGPPEAAEGKEKWVGRPAPYRFRITGLAPGSAKLHFAYVRPWEGEPNKSEDLWVRIE
jgi:predicted secreted protein